MFISFHTSRFLHGGTAQLDCAVLLDCAGRLHIIQNESRKKKQRSREKRAFVDNWNARLHVAHSSLAGRYTPPPRVSLFCHGKYQQPSGGIASAVVVELAERVEQLVCFLATHEARHFCFSDLSPLFPISESSPPLVLLFLLVLSRLRAPFLL